MTPLEAVYAFFSPGSEESAKKCGAIRAAHVPRSRVSCPVRGSGRTFLTLANCLSTTVSITLSTIPVEAPDCHSGVGWPSVDHVAIYPRESGTAPHFLALPFLRAVGFSDKINWAEGYDVEGRPVNQIALPEQGDEPLEVWPSVFGGLNMYPAAYNPDSGMIFLPAANLGMMYGYEEVKVISNVRNLGTTFEFLFDREDAYEVNLAMDVKSGNEIWRDQKTKWGFAGGLVFYTSQNGDFQAVDAASGEILYAVNLGTAPKSGPITYMLDGQQYVVQAVGGVPGGGFEEHRLEHGGLVVAFSR